MSKAGQLMNVAIKPEIAKLLAAQVAAGRFASVEAAIEALTLDDAAAQVKLDAADLRWAKTYLDVGIADVAADRTLPADDVHAELRARFLFKDK